MEMIMNASLYCYFQTFVSLQAFILYYDVEWQRKTKLIDKKSVHYRNMSLFFVEFVLLS